MAEGWTRKLRHESVDACSAGTQPKGIDPLAVRAMAEVGVDLSASTSKSPADLDLSALDVVVTVCGHADETCPELPLGVRKVHVGFDDPPALARDVADEEAVFEIYRRVRDEIRRFVEGLPATLSGDAAASRDA